jgi:hypothetical protein
LVLAGEPFDTKWIDVINGGYLVRWNFGDANADEEVERIVSSVPSAAFAPGEMHFMLVDECDFFDSAMPGLSIVTPSQTVDLEPGGYLIGTTWYEPDPETSFLLHRFRRHF